MTACDSTMTARLRRESLRDGGRCRRVDGRWQCGATSPPTARCWPRTGAHWRRQHRLQAGLAQGGKVILLYLSLSTTVIESVRLSALVLSDSHTCPAVIAVMCAGCAVTVTLAPTARPHPDVHRRRGVLRLLPAGRAAAALPRGQHGPARVYHFVLSSTAIP
jgi:hypothetical protein